MVKVMREERIIDEGKEKARILCKLHRPGAPGLIGVIEEDTDLYKIVAVLHLINGMPMTMNQAAETKIIGKETSKEWIICFWHLCRICMESGSFRTISREITLSWRKVVKEKKRKLCQ